MLQYLVKRLLLMFVTLFGIMLLTFVLTRLTPGDPAAMKISGASGGGSRSVGSYDDLVERNRRNLGLDKPQLLNLHFEDRTVLAHRAIDDLLREDPSEFWKKDAEKRLGRISTIALGPAIERLEQIGTPQERKPSDSKGAKLRLVDAAEQRKRLVGVMPRLAADTELKAPADPAEALAFWKKWQADNAGRFAEQTVAAAVADYVGEADAAKAAEKLQGVLAAGGFAVVHLMPYIQSSDDRELLRANSALQGLTGFNFLSRESELAKERDDVVRRWNSWWRRELIAYSQFGSLRHGVNIFMNTQFGLWCTQAMTFDFGDSYIKRRPVIALMKDALPVSLSISLLSIFFSYIIAIPIGILSAVKKNTPVDRTITIALFILYSLPTFWVAGLLLMTTTGKPFFDWFPARGLNSEGMYLDKPGVAFGDWLQNRLWHLVLPVTCLTYGSLAFLSRQMRSSMLETVKQDFIRTARAKGLASNVVIFKHALRNSLIPILTISAGLLPELIAGAVIIESIFTIPGMGTLTFEAIVNRDYPIINAVLFFSAFLTLLGILLADFSYALADPRITYN